MQDIQSSEQSKVIFEYPLKKKYDDNAKEESIKNKTLNDIIENIKNSSRTEQWYKETSTRLKSMLDMINLQHHDHAKVRYEMCALSEDIIVQCAE